MVNTDSAYEDLFQFRSGPLGEIKGLDPLGHERLTFFVDELLSFEQFGNLPTLLAIETEDQARCSSSGFISFRDAFEMFIEVSVVNILKLQWNFSFRPLNKLQIAAMRSMHPATKIDAVADCCRQQHRTHMLGHHPEG